MEMANSFMGIAILVLVLCLSAAACHAQGAETEPLRVGMARVEITPQEPAYMAGFAGRKERSTGAYKDITASCLVFDNGVMRLGLMAVDVLFIDRYYKTDLGPVQLTAIRKAAEAVGIAPERMMINASHTHCGPKFEDNGDYPEVFIEKVCGLLEAAVADLQPARLDYTVGTCSMAINRRRTNEEGKCTGMRPTPLKPIDMEVPVMRVVSPEDQARAIIFGYACHPSTMGGLEIGPDYPGFARDWVEAAYGEGCMATFLQGCGGDIKPRNVSGTSRFRSGPLETVEELGHELGRAVVTATCVPPEPVAAAANGSVLLAATSQIVPLPSKKDPSQPYPIEMQVLRIGDVYIVGMNGEICVEIGLHIKRELAGLKLFVIGYCNQRVSYIPAASSYPEGGYEVNCTRVAPTGEDMIVAKAVEMTRSLATLK